MSKFLLEMNKQTKRKQLCFSFQVEGSIQHYQFSVTFNSLLFGNCSQAYLLLYNITTMLHNIHLRMQNLKNRSELVEN